jgi:branched-chain amino acid transport system substrate-binding protein
VKRLIVLFTVFTMILGLDVASALAASPAKPKPSFLYEDKIGVVKIKPGEPIHIACWFAVAGSEASLGIDSKRGVEIAIEDKGRKLLGFPIKLPGAPILWRAGIVTVSPSNTAPELTSPKRGTEYAGYLRTAHNDKVQGAVAAEFAYKKLVVRRAATIHDGSPYSEQLQAVFAATFKRLGGTITSQEAVAPTDTDMRPVLTKIATGKPEFIYYPVFIAAGGHITRQAKEVAGLEKVYLMGADGVFSPDFYKAAGEAAINMFHSSPDFSAFAGGYKSFLEKHQKKYGEKPLSVFHAHAYDATMMIFGAIERVAKKAPDGTLYIGRQALRDALYATKGFKGLTGTLTCDAYGDCADPRIAVYQTTADNVKKLVMPDKPFWKPY